MATTKNGYVRIDRERSRSLTDVTVHGCSTRLRAGSSATILRWVASQIDGAGIERAGHFYGWRGATTNTGAGGITNSNHLSGTAIDFNGGLHPYEHTHPTHWTSGWSASDQAHIRKILGATDGAVGWGLDYGVGWRDAMHFEILVGTNEAARVAARLTTGWVSVTTRLNGRSKPSTTSRIKFVRATGFRIRFVEVAYREGRVWLRTKFNTWYAADLTTW